jgi:glycosyltransferase involved in cell wall biosynthesis
VIGTNLKIAYLVNEYPKVSHTFIRREILALERIGFTVLRIAVRGWNGPSPDADDISERAKTQYVLQDGAWALVAPVAAALLRSPVRFLRALRLATKMAGDSDRSLIHHLVYLAEACRIRPWLERQQICRIHAHFGTNSSDVAVLAHVLGGPPFSFTVHGPEEFLRPVALREKIRRSSFVVAISSFGRSQLSLWTDFADWEKIKVVHCGLEPSFYAGAAPITANVPRVVCVGRLIEAKGQFLLIEAAARLAAQGLSFELVLAGDGPARATIESLIESHQLRGRVRITGWISSAQVREEILAARAMILPSFAEGLPVVIMEAMSLRRPVLATYVAGIPELVHHRENGWLFPAGSIDDLTQALQECLTTPLETLRRMGDRAYEAVTTRHCIDTEAAKLGQLFAKSA